MNFPLSKLIFIRRLFLAQCINHGVAIFLTLFWIFVGMAIGIESNQGMSRVSQIDLNAGLGFLLVVYFSGVFSRAMSILFFGTTLGFSLMKLEPKHDVFTRNSWIGVFWESAHLPVIAFWVLEWILRFQGFRLWNDFDSEKSAIL
jgi:hypothetical protein